MEENALRPSDLSWEKKLDYLKSLSEDDFRDTVVRPLFERKGLKHIRSTCGPEEEGKDAIFEGTDSLNRLLIYAIQAKKGNVNLASKATENLTTALTQIRTMLETDIYLTSTKQRVKPDYVLLCASGSINQAARRHIHDNINDRRIDFYDAEELIPQLDKHFAELWMGIDAKLFPYLRQLKQQLLTTGDTVISIDMNTSTKGASPITDEAYVTLYVHRITDEIEKRHGEVHRVPKLDQIPVDGLLKRRERLIWIRGEGGAGKTTALRRLAYELIEKSLKQPADKLQVPVMLSASEIATLIDSVATLAIDATRRVSTSDTAAIGAEDLRQGRVVLLVDALDEVHGAAHREAVIHKLMEFHLAYPDCFLILTSRDYGSITALPGLRDFMRYQITSLDLRQAAKIVDRLATGRKLNKEDATEMLRRLQDVHGIALNPMLVTVFVATSDFNRKDIPPNITEIFAKYTELMLGRWDEKKGLGQQYEAKLKDAVLGAVAAEMHKAQIRAVRVGEFTALATSFLNARGYESEAPAIIEEILNRSNLVRTEEDEVAFRHHILQEFFAGRGISEVAQLSGVVDDEWWRKPIVFHFGDRPREVEKLRPLIDAAEGMSPLSQLEASVTIGLAAQACYLSELSEKKMIVKWVIKSLALGCDEFTKLEALKPDKYPNRAFVFYYLHGRDAVASDLVEEALDDLEAEQAKQNELFPGGQELLEREVFWGIAGLLEAGKVEEALARVRTYKPKDLRLLLAIHLGAFFVANLRITKADKKKFAQQICDRLRPRVGFLAGQVSKEFDGYLLEMKDGEVVARDGGKNDDPTIPAK
jgi:hypothetical protein